MDSSKGTQRGGASEKEIGLPAQNDRDCTDAINEKHGGVDHIAGAEHGGMGQTMLEPEAISDAGIPSNTEISRQSTRASERTVPPPDGGLRAWTACESRSSLQPAPLLINPPTGQAYVLTSSSQTLGV